MATLTLGFALQCIRSDIVAQAVAGWSVQQFIFTADDDDRASAMTDTTVAVAPARHSLRINLPTGKPVVLPLPGQQLVKPSTGAWCNPAWNCKAAALAPLNASLYLATHLSQSFDSADYRRIIVFHRSRCRVKLWSAPRRPYRLASLSECL